MAVNIVDFIDTPWIMPYQLDKGREYVLVIRDFHVEDLEARPGLKATRTVSLGIGAKRRLLLSSNTNKRVLAAMFGNDVEKWIGKRIAIQVGRFPKDPGRCDRVIVGAPTRGAKTRDDAGAIRDDAPPPDQGAPEPGAEPREPGSDG